MKFEKHEVEWTHDKVSRFWDYISGNNALRHHFFGLQVGEHVALFINRKLKFKKFKNILDLSCGKGDILNSCLSYLKEGQNVYGTDFSEANVRHVNARFKKNSVFREAYLIQEYPIHFTSEFFNLIIITEVVEHLNDEELDAMLYEVNRLLAKDGYIFITTPNNENLEKNKVMCPDCGCLFHQWQHVRKWTSASLKKKVEQYSFRPELITPITWGSPLIKRLALRLAVQMSVLSCQGLVCIGKKQI
ncbi:MAG: class I SAM-dependent methyltransferase [Waddliaceae bacterium]